MEKGKNIDMELTEEDLRRKLHRLKQEIQETRERRMEVEIATAIARVANTALDEELAAKMARYATLNEETVAMRKEHDVFNKDITRRLQKIHEKCSFFNQEANSGPEDTHPETTEEDTEEEIVYRPPFQGQLICVDKLAEHPYFTRSKGPTDSFPGQISRKGKSTMGDNLIVQLMQQIAEMRVEMQRRQDLPNPAFIAPADGRPSLHFPPPNAEQAHNPPSSPIVKVGETIEDGLRTGKIARVAASPGSSGLLKKKREDVSSIFYEGKKIPRKSPSYQGRSRPSQNLYPACHAQADYHNTPPPSYHNTPPPSYQLSPPIYQTPPPVYQNPPHHYRNVAPNCANVQANYQAPPPTYQTPAPLYQNNPPNYQAPQPNYQTNSYPRYQASRPNTPNYRQMPPPQQGNYDPPRPRFEKLTVIFTPLVESRAKLFERLTAAGYIHPVGPKPVDTSSRFYRPDQRCAYHSNSVGHDTEDCINLKHKIQDLIDQKVVSLQTVAPNVNSNPLPNHGGVTINMIETDDDWCVTKAIVPIAPDNLERAVASLSIREKREFVILTPEKVVALVPRETPDRPKFVIETAVTQGMTRSGRCYTPEELS
ncbi:hypothetical protein R3W88_016752 [Solanum pinnatisectum]|uniref:Hop-interacting protein n=1 Tax=Solanum pinnatisectum TaxID=50273 RepID=A0AAV9L0Q8_9SOLN|nr:hypothetical protein R3W88_016752 [Solanum pinnatisectum]